ncbi:MAG: hypothetical protein MAG581_02316 [Deltaproteobacteria bacterium]|jgi:hypothetical protein|nr:hypothetical protein [Deltaproteobacteria bacterium]
MTRKMIDNLIKMSRRLVFSFLCIMLAITIEVCAQKKSESSETHSEDHDVFQSEDHDSSTPTVFGGVGRKFPTWQAGLDLIVLGNPHYSAFRNQLKMGNRVLWGEWWGNDLWGIKLLHSEQSFNMFSSSGNSQESNTRHLGILAKVQHPLSVDMKISGGIGMANTEFTLGSQSKYGNSLVSEFRIGMELFPDFWTEAGFLTIDGASGSGSEDQRLGSSSYLIGLSYGF